MTEPVQMRDASSGWSARAITATRGSTSKPCGPILTPRSAAHTGSVTSRWPLAQPTSSYVPSLSIGTARCWRLARHPPSDTSLEPDPPGPPPAATYASSSSAAVRRSQASYSLTT